MPRVVFLYKAAHGFYRVNVFNECKDAVAFQSNDNLDISQIINWPLGLTYEGCLLKRNARKQLEIFNGELK